MRIIAGKKRGMKLLSPKTIDSRPILDRVKESLFSVLYNYGLPDGKIVADLFCGVGSIGLEALSRGAVSVTFIEKDPKISAILKKNIESCGFVKESLVLQADVFKIGAPVREEKYDIIFIDPPYPLTADVGKGSSLDGLLEIVAGQLEGNGFVVVRTRRQTELLDNYGRLEIIEQRQWGTMAITLLRLNTRL